MKKTTALCLFGLLLSPAFATGIEQSKQSDNGLTSEESDRTDRQETFMVLDWPKNVQHRPNFKLTLKRPVEGDNDTITTVYCYSNESGYSYPPIHRGICFLEPNPLSSNLDKNSRKPFSFFENQDGSIRLYGDGQITTNGYKLSGLIDNLQVEKFTDSKDLDYILGIDEKITNLNGKRIGRLVSQ